MATKEELLASLAEHLKATRQIEDFLAENLPLHTHSEKIAQYKELADRDQTARETYERVRNEYWTQETPGE
jgi:hypothetical protein